MSVSKSARCFAAASSTFGATSARTFACELSDLGVYVDALALAYPLARARSLRVHDAQQGFACSLAEEPLARGRRCTQRRWGKLLLARLVIRAKLFVVTQMHAQPPRSRAHPLPNGYLRKHLLHPMQRRVRPSPADTRRAEPAPLARERHEPLVAATLTPDPNAAKLQEPASQVLLNLTHHESW